jgi:hypothetical protein
MRAADGHVVDGKVVVAGERLRDGAAVVVLFEDDAPPSLTDSDIEALQVAQSAVRDGAYVTADEVFAYLARKRG